MLKSTPTTHLHSLTGRVLWQSWSQVTRRPTRFKSQQTYQNFLPRPGSWERQFPQAPVALCTVSLLSWKKITHCSFNFHFHNYQWGWASFPMFIEFCFSSADCLLVYKSISLLRSFSFSNQSGRALWRVWVHSLDLLYIVQTLCWSPIPLTLQ